VHPVLCLFQSNALAIAYRQQNRGKIEARLQQVEQAAAALEDRQMGRLLAGQAATTRTVMAAMIPSLAADPRKHFALVQRTLDLLSEDDPARSAVTLTIGYAQLALHDAQAGIRAMEEARRLSLACQNYYAVVEAIFHQARIAHSQGHLRRGAEICRQGRKEISALLSHPKQELPAVGCLDIALGCILLEQDHLEEAERWLLNGLDLIGWGMIPHYLMTAGLALFRLREIQGRSKDALEFLARLEAAWPDIAFCTEALRIVHALRVAPEDRGTLADASAWCRTSPLPFGVEAPLPGMGPFGAAEVYYLASLAWVRVQIAIGDPQAGMGYLERQLAAAETHGLTTRVIELSLLEAQAAQASGDDRRTWAALQRALAAALPEGFIRIFDQGPVLARLLLDAPKHGIPYEPIERLLAAITGPEAERVRRSENAALPDAAAQSSPPAWLESGEHLSERELEVLRLMARGASNQAIAEQLVITIGTVKSHINHILGKLDAHNRTEAVAQARGLGLLDI